MRNTEAGKGLTLELPGKESEPGGKKPAGVPTPVAVVDALKEKDWKNPRPWFDALSQKYW